MRSRETPSACTHAPEVSPPATTRRRAPRSTSARATRGEEPLEARADVVRRRAAPAPPRPLAAARCCRRAPARSGAAAHCASRPGGDALDQRIVAGAVERERIDPARRAAGCEEVRHLRVGRLRAAARDDRAKARAPAAATPTRSKPAMPKFARQADRQARAGADQRQIPDRGAEAQQVVVGDRRRRSRSPRRLRCERLEALADRRARGADRAVVDQADAPRRASVGRASAPAAPAARAPGWRRSSASADGCACRFPRAARRRRTGGP